MLLKNHFSQAIHSRRNLRAYLKSFVPQIYEGTFIYPVIPVFLLAVCKNASPNANSAIFVQLFRDLATLIDALCMH